ncbi:MAG: sulfatase [Spirochaetaceae bacterium]|nr:sulfatase [Spirochaetaceae bacterium]
MANSRPNFLFLIAHDISLRFGCYGDPRAVTPNIDALAAGGALFENAFCQFPMCAPARTCLMTGCRPGTVQRYGIGAADFYAGLRRRLPWIRTLPELLRGAGYRTVSLHKVLHEYEADPPSWSEPPWYAATGAVPAWCPDDFDCRERARRYRSAANRSLMEARFRLLQAAEPDAITQFKRWRGGPVEREPAGDQDYYAGATADQAIALLHAHAAERDAPPLFLGVGFCNTHLPWLAPEHYWRLHDATDFGAGAGYDTARPSPLAEELAVAGNEPFQYYRQDDHVPGARAAWQPTALQAQELRRGHYAAVSYLDAQVGRILTALDDTGLAGSTVVVFTTDHGFALGEHRHWGKGMPWEPDLRVPFLLRTPHGGAGQRVAALAEHIDLLPTLLEQAGLEPPAWAEGASLTPLLRNPAAPGKQAVFSRAVRGALTAHSARTPHHRYTRWLDPAGRLHAEELYDHRSDPAETHNLAADADRSLLTRLRTLFPSITRS